jgi:hypothetical protein
VQPLDHEVAVEAGEPLVDEGELGRDGVQHIRHSTE